MKRVAVLGAGVAGLTTAYELSKKGVEVTLFEAAPRVGGKVRTESNEGVVYEAGPDSFVTNKPEALELIKELGLDGDLLPTDEKRKTVWVYTGGRLIPMPEGLALVLPTKIMPFALSPLLSWKAKFRMAAEPFMPKADASVEDESLGDFFLRRVGQEAVDKLVAPMLAGIYASDPYQMSLRSTFPMFADMEAKGGLLRAMLGRKAPQMAPGRTLFMTLKGGLSKLTEAIAAKLPAGSIRLGAQVTGLKRRGAAWEVSAGGEKLSFDAVVAALPANAMAAAAESLDPELSAVLRELPAVSTATVTLVYERAAFPKELDGFGFLIPRGEERKLTAGTYVSTKFPGRVPPELVMIRCFIGGAGKEGDAELDEAALCRNARAELRDVLGLGEAHPLWARAARWPKSNPQYVVGHGLRLKRIESCLQSHPGLILAGASYKGVGIPDCIRSGRLAAQAALRALQKPAPAVC